LEALVDFIARNANAAFGLDFPFGLPKELVPEGSWEEFLSAFPKRYPNSAEFFHACHAATGGKELRRKTDQECQTPFSPYNLRIYRQTYFGIREVLAPLVLDGLILVLPMQPPGPEHPWVLEVCPASTLKQEGLHRPYKGRKPVHYQSRVRILESLETTGLISVSERLRATVLRDHGGDALDSVIAAFATFRAVSQPSGLSITSGEAYTREGYVYL
jgi:hypothetical protein